MNFVRRRWSWLAVAGLALGGPAFGQEGNPDETFAKLDKNGDGKLVASEVPEERKRFFERLLRTGDKDGNGELTKEEFVAGLKDAPAPQRRPGAGDGGAPGGRPFVNPEEMFKRIDANGDGKITKEEAPERMKEFFDRLDANKDGGLTIEEFKNRGPGAGGPEDFFKQMDSNGDGKLSKDEVRGPLKERFEQLDADKDGSLTLEEIRKGRPQGGQPGPGGREEFFKRMDANGDGKVSKDEAQGPLKERFDQLDGNKDGFVTPEELRAARPEGARPAGRPEGAGGFFDQLDKNKDGKITKDEAPERMKERFDQIDANKDGALDREELIKAFRDRFGAGTPPRKPQP